VRRLPLASLNVGDIWGRLPTACAGSRLSSQRACMDQGNRSKDAPGFGDPLKAQQSLAGDQPNGSSTACGDSPGFIVCGRGTVCRDSPAKDRPPSGAPVPGASLPLGVGPRSSTVSWQPVTSPVRLSVCRGRTPSPDKAGHGGATKTRRPALFGSLAFVGTDTAASGRWFYHKAAVFGGYGKCRIPPRRDKVRTRPARRPSPFDGLKACREWGGRGEEGPNPAKAGRVRGRRTAELTCKCWRAKPCPSKAHDRRYLSGAVIC
jgi:hypothetical protein